VALTVAAMAAGASIYKWTTVSPMPAEVTSIAPLTTLAPSPLVQPRMIERELHHLTPKEVPPNPLEQYPILASAC